MKIVPLRVEILHLHTETSDVSPEFPFKLIVGNTCDILGYSLQFTRPQWNRQESATPFY